MQDKNLVLKLILALNEAYRLPPTSTKFARAILEARAALRQLSDVLERDPIGHTDALRQAQDAVFLTGWTIKNND